MVEPADKLNERFFPAEPFKNQFADLDKLRDLKLINPDVFDKACGKPPSGWALAGKPT